MMRLIVSTLFLTVIVAAIGGNGTQAQSQQPSTIPAPPDVKAPPNDAKKSLGPRILRVETAAIVLASTIIGNQIV